MAKGGGGGKSSGGSKSSSSSASKSSSSSTSSSRSAAAAAKTASGGPGQGNHGGVAPGAPNTIGGRNVSPATQKVQAANAAAKASGDTGPGFAPGSRPAVITVSGGSVFQNGKLINSYGVGPTANAKAQAKAQQMTSPGAGGKTYAVMGDKGGETYRQLNRVDQGKQTGKANVAGIVNANASRNKATAVETSGGVTRVTGTMSDKSAQKFANAPTSSNLATRRNAISPSLYSRIAPVLRDQTKEQQAREQIIKDEGIDVDTASPSKLQLLDEKVNTQVYGQAYPTFKTGPNVLSTEQKAQEMAVAASASKDTGTLATPVTPENKSVDEESGRVRTVITSDEARRYTGEQRERLREMQSGADATATDTVNSLTDTDSDVQEAIQAGEDATALLEQRREFYGQVYNDTVDRIKQAFDDKEQGYREAAKVEMGSTIAMLARMGAYGTTTAAVQYINDVNRENEAKIMALAAEEAAAIQKAFEAYQEADFDIAEKMIQVAKDSRDEVRTIRSENLDRQMKLKQLQKLEQEEASATVETLINAGYDPEDLPQGYLDSLDAKQGLPFGTSERMYRVNQATRAAQAAQDAQTARMTAAKDLIGIMKDLPAGTSINIDGVEYSSINTGTWNTGTEEDGSGNVTLWAYNEDTGETKVQSLGKIGNASGWQMEKDNNGNIVSVNPNTGEMRVIYQAGMPMGGQFNSGGIYDAFPDGSDGGQCGSFVEGIYGDLGYITPKENKLALIDSSIGTDANPPVAGDLFIQDVGTYGHIGIVTRAVQLDDGSYQLDIVDSNSNLDEKVHHRTINSKNVRGYARRSMKEEYQFGTDGGTVLDFSAKGEDASLSPSEQASLRKEIASDKAIAQYQTISSAFNNITALYEETTKLGTKDSKAALDNALVMAFNKMLDPDSVVREGEFARTTQGQSIFAAVQGFIDAKAAGGAGITDATRREMVRAAEILANQAEEAYQDSIDFYVPTLEEYNLDPARYIKGYTVGTGTVSDPDRQSYVYTDPNDPEIQSALDAGWSAFQNEDGTVTITSP